MLDADDMYEIYRILWGYILSGNVEETLRYYREAAKKLSTSHYLASYLKVTSSQQRNQEMIQCLLEENIAKTSSSTHLGDGLRSAIPSRTPIEKAVMDRDWITVNTILTSLVSG